MKAGSLSTRPFNGQRTRPATPTRLATSSSLPRSLPWRSRSCAIHFALTPAAVGSVVAFHRCGHLRAHHRDWRSGRKNARISSASSSGSSRAGKCPPRGSSAHLVTWYVRSASFPRRRSAGTNSSAKMANPAGTSTRVPDRSGGVRSRAGPMTRSRAALPPSRRSSKPGWRRPGLSPGAWPVPAMGCKRLSKPLRAGCRRLHWGGRGPGYGRRPGPAGRRHPGTGRHHGQHPDHGPAISVCRTAGGPRRRARPVPAGLASQDQSAAQPNTGVWAHAVAAGSDHQVMAIRAAQIAAQNTAGTRPAASAASAGPRPAPRRRRPR